MLSSLLKTHRLLLSFDEHLRRRLAEHDLTLDELRLLALVAEAPGLRPTAVTRALGVAFRNQVESTLRGLLARDLVSAELEGKAHRWVLTELGSAALADLSRGLHWADDERTRAALAGLNELLEEAVLAYVFRQPAEPWGLPDAPAQHP